MFLQLHKFNQWVALQLPGVKTKLWATFLMASGGLLSGLQVFDVIDLRTYIHEEWASWVMLFSGMITYWLRTVTVVPGTVVAPIPTTVSLDA